LGQLIWGEMPLFPLPFQASTIGSSVVMLGYWVTAVMSYLLVVACSSLCYFLPSISFPTLRVLLQLHQGMLDPPNKYPMRFAPRYVCCIFVIKALLITRNHQSKWTLAVHIDTVKIIWIDTWFFLVSRVHKRIPHLPTLGDMSWLLITNREKILMRIYKEMQTETKDAKNRATDDRIGTGEWPLYLYGWEPGLPNLSNFGEIQPNSIDSVRTRF
jgi:hypothetical protein